MAMVNIPSTCTDPSYRYKMPRLVTKIEGRGNGTKTSVCNMGDVARPVKRRPEETTKWFGYELGASSKYTNKEGEGERCLINGGHNTDVFQALLDKFIEKYVLCENCKLPEIDMMVKKGLVAGKCKACGWAGELDNAHRLAAHIVRNPPDAGGFGEEGNKLDKKARQAARAAKSQKKAKEAKDSDEEDGSDDDKENQKKVVKKEKREKSEKKEKKQKASDEESDEDAPKKKNTYKAEQKKKEKKEKTERKPKKGNGSGSDDAAKREEDDQAELTWDDERTKDVIGVMMDFVDSKQGKPSVADFFEEIRMQQIAKVFDHKVRLYVGLEALFGDAMNAKQIVAKKAYINKLLSTPALEPPDALWAFNVYVEAHPEATKSFALVLKALYDEDILEEKPLLAYYETCGAEVPGFEAAKKAAGPFLQWLQTAESEDSDSD